MSRTALLDIFVMFWVLAAFGCLVVDRDRSRARIAAAAAAGTAGTTTARAGARHPLVARGGRAVPGRRRGVEVERDLVPARVPAAHRGLGPGRAPRGRVRRPVAGRAGPRREVAAGHVRGACRWPPTWRRGAAGSPRRTATTGTGRRCTATTRRCWSALDSLYQYNRYMLQFGLGLTTGHPYKSQPWTWLADHQAGLVLLRDAEDLRRADLLPGGAGHRHAADLVRVDPGAADPADLVAGAPGLAGGRGAPGRRRRVAAVVLVRPARSPDRVLLLRGDLRPVPRHRDHAVPRA